MNTEPPIEPEIPADPEDKFIHIPGISDHTRSQTFNHLSIINAVVDGDPIYEQSVARKRERASAPTIKLPALPVFAEEIRVTLPPAQRKTNSPGIKESRSFQILSAFAWFCGPENKAHISVIKGDLKKDRRGMLKEGRSTMFISCVLFTRTLGVLVPIISDSVLRLIKPVAKIRNLLP